MDACIKSIYASHTRPPKLEDADLAHTLFDCWYESAKDFSGSVRGEDDRKAFVSDTLKCLNCLLSARSEPLRCNEGEYSFLATLELLQKFVEIFTHKPKFFDVVRAHHPHECTSLRTTLCGAAVTFLEGRAAAFSGNPARVRNACIHLLVDIVMLGIALSLDARDSFPKPPVRIDSALFIKILCDATTDQELRHASADLLLCCVRGDVHAEGVLDGVAAQCSDGTGLDLLWRCGSLASGDGRVFTAVKERVLVEGSSLTASGTASGTFGCSVLESVTKYLVSLTTEPGTDEVERALALAVAHNNMCCRDVDTTSVSHICPFWRELVVQLLRSDSKRAAQEAVAVLLGQGTQCAVSAVSGLSDRLGEAVWLDVVLPWTHRRIAAFPSTGVSGNETEQEVIDMLRECWRVLYDLRVTGRPSVVAGHLLFDAVMCAISHGYIETERFPFIAACICREHSADAPTCCSDWLSVALDDTFCSTHRTMRAMKEMLDHILTASATSDRDPAVKIVLECLITKGSVAAYTVVREYVVDRSRHFESPAVRATLVDTMLESISLMVKCRSVDHSCLAVIVEIAEILARQTTPDLSVPLFDLFLRATTLIRAFPACSASDAAGARSVEHFGKLTEECLPRIIDQVPLGTTVTPEVLQQALRIGGSRTRASLARIIPVWCLADASPIVRTAAFASLGANLVGISLPAIADRLLKGCQISRHDRTTEADENDKISRIQEELPLGIAASPVLASLASEDPRASPSCLRELVRIAQLSRKHSPQTKASPVVVHALESVLHKASAAVKASFSTSLSDASLVSALEKLSPAWHEFLTGMRHDSAMEGGSSRRSDGYVPLATVGVEGGLSAGPIPPNADPYSQVVLEEGIPLFATTSVPVELGPLAVTSQAGPKLPISPIEIGPRPVSAPVLAPAFNTDYTRLHLRESPPPYPVIALHLPCAGTELVNLQAPAHTDRTRTSWQSLQNLVLTSDHLHPPESAPPAPPVPTGLPDSERTMSLLRSIPDVPAHTAHTAPTLDTVPTQGRRSSKKHDKKGRGAVLL